MQPVNFLWSKPQPMRGRSKARHRMSNSQMLQQLVCNLYLHSKFSLTTYLRLKSKRSQGQRSIKISCVAYDLCKTVCMSPCCTLSCLRKITSPWHYVMEILPQEANLLKSSCRPTSAFQAACSYGEKICVYLNCYQRHSWAVWVAACTTIGETLSILE